MAKKPGTRSELIFFNVLYEDGSQRSNRRVPSEATVGHDADARVRAVIEQQDQEIAEKSGVPAAAIKTIVRASK